MSRPPKALVAEWYSRLKAEGFSDIEDTDSPREMLKEWHSTLFIRRYDTERFQARRTYYEMATHFLHSHAFRDEQERDIWRRHSDGESLRAIAKAVSSPAKTFSKDEIAKIIKALHGKMKDEQTTGH